MRNLSQSHRYLSAICVLLAASSFAADAAESAYGGSAPAMGYRSPPVQPKITRSAARAKAGTSTLPARWDSREAGWISSIKNQGNVNCCWTFSACAVLETQLLKAGLGEMDFSEKHMASLHGYVPGPNDGGNSDIATSYLLGWRGPVAEQTDPFYADTNSWASHPSVPSAARHVRIKDVVWIPGREDEYDNDILKEAVLAYGAVDTSVFWSQASAYCTSDGCYYYNESTDSNHAVTLIGWDDAYPASNFATTPPGDGAWIIKNSWGPDSGDGGYYHVSYHDRTFAFERSTVFVPATSDDTFSAVYGYDTAYVGTYSSTGHTLQAASFTSGWNEELAAVGVFSYCETLPYTLSVWTNVTRGASSPTASGKLALVQTGTLSHAGFSTIEIPSGLKLADGTGFSVMLEHRSSDSEKKFAFCYRYDGYANPPDIPAGSTWLGQVSTFWNRAGTNWTDAINVTTDDSGCVCMKAFTRSTASAPEGDLPDEGDDGSLFDLWPPAHGGAGSLQHAGTAAAAANSVGANGRTLWASFLAGFDPSNPADSAFTAWISCEGGNPRLWWTPDLGAARRYTVEGRMQLDGGDGWRTVSTNDLTSSRFFRVSVGLP